ncbi:unnamed protein product [Parascedosporium putredinis]|uniref:Heterokaryon incompatibility domain-containing protein n=1 Tax=Parascedosporium putredinis TaxID=1442378 RepID=A0A9P1H0D3_9PEZI|nr:unnamed protein product [Parascedosporium putredinis]CAI7991659.1 unnamed protein product [Parascedosporium putredinis]
MPKSSFLYTPLMESTEIRLVEVLPARDPADPISARLFIQSLANPDMIAPYTALSTWGDPDDTVPIVVDNQTLPVTRNLEAALRRYRDELPKPKNDPHPTGEGIRGPTNLVWVDAICINQANTMEKSAQVAQMSNIYTSAASVFAWLGPATDESHLAFEKIGAVMDRYRRMTGADPPDKVPGWAARLMVDELMLCEGEEEDEAIWKSVQDLFDREWWSRRVKLDDAIIFAVLAAMNEQVDEDAATRVYPLSSFVYTIDSLRSNRDEDGSDGELLNTLMSCRHFDATDPRDKVYGILGMVSPRSSWKLLADYSREIVDVYSDVVQYQLETSGYEGKLDFLGADGLPEGGITGLPSWLPDWRYRDRYHVPFKKLLDDEATTPRPGRQQSESCVYTASGTIISLAKLGINPSTVAAIDGRSLRVKGFRVGFLYDIQPIFEPGRSHVLNTWRSSLHTTPYFTGETEPQAFNRLIVADIDEDVRAAARQGPKSSPAADDRPRAETFIACSGRRFARLVQKNWSSDGLALVPQCVREGDQIFALLGGQVLYALRSLGDGTHKFLGECYVHGMMDGEVLDMLKTGVVELGEVSIR